MQVTKACAVGRFEMDIAPLECKRLTHAQTGIKDQRSHIAQGLWGHLKIERLHFVTQHKLAVSLPGQQAYLRYAANDLAFMG